MHVVRDNNIVKAYILTLDLIEVINDFAKRANPDQVHIGKGLTYQEMTQSHITEQIIIWAAKRKKLSLGIPTK